MSSNSPLIFATLLVAVGGLALRGRGRAHRARVPASGSMDPLASGSMDPPAAVSGVAPAATVALAAPWMHAVKKALNHGGTQRKGRDRSAAKRKHVQLATVDPVNGRPSVRTVVFRGFLPRKFVDGEKGGESCCLMFITDDRSAKVRHLAADGAPVEVCWWLDEPGVQFRISGHARLANAKSDAAVLRSAIDDVWTRLGDSSRRTFFWPAPGEPVEAAAASVDSKADSLHDSHFTLLLVVPDAVDELHLGGNQRRIVYERLDQDNATGTDEWPLASMGSATWSEQAVNP